MAALVLKSSNQSFDSAAVLDYVLRIPVVAGDTVLEDAFPAGKAEG